MPGWCTICASICRLRPTTTALAQWLDAPVSPTTAADGLRSGPADTVVLYLATSPHLFPQICEQLGQVGLNGPRIRVVLEKPLGHDLQSAQEINRVVSAVFDETQAMRIDHYLGKSAVQNLMALRFGNALFEPLWRRESIANIQITLAEQIGVGTRGDFYDRTGALRDMIQNHALQLLTMIAMEPPSRNDADAIRTEKLKVLQASNPSMRKACRATWCAASTGPAMSTASRSPATSSPPACRRTAAPKPSSRCAPKCRTGAGPACRSICAPANAWPRRKRRSSSIFGRRRTASSLARTSRTSW